MSINAASAHSFIILGHARYYNKLQYYNATYNLTLKLINI